LKATIVALTAAIVCAVALTSKAETRSQAFVRLPNWTGQWQGEGDTPDASGGIEESFEQVMESFKPWGSPSYTVQWQAVVDQVNAGARRADEAMRTNDAVPSTQRMCAFGFPQIMIQSPLMFEALTTPEETALIFSGREIRHIYTDGRAHTPKDELWPTVWGDSIGHWEGQTLVIDTIAVSAPPWAGNSPVSVFVFGATAEGGHFVIIAVFSPEARFSERLRMLDKDHLEDQMTVIDPLALAAPWHLVRNYRRVTTLHRMVHEDCEGEDRNPIVNGRYITTPPPPSPFQPASSAASH
jgi:hypothetical protein